MTYENRDIRGTDYAEATRHFVEVSVPNVYQGMDPSDAAREMQKKRVKTENQPPLGELEREIIIPFFVIDES